MRTDKKDIIMNMNVTTTKYDMALKTARSSCLSLERQAGTMGMWEACPADGRYLSPQSEREVREEHTKDMLSWVESVRAEYTYLYEFVKREEGRTRPRNLTHPEKLYFRWVR
jgi:hypothetical protein